MKKGQIFIMIAFVIALALAELGSLYTYSSLTSQTGEAKIADTLYLLKNFQNELQFIATVNSSDISMFMDFTQFVSNFSGVRGFITTVNST